MSIRLIQDLHAGISRRDWHAVETAANRLRDDVEKTVAILAGTGVGSLPNDFPLSKLAANAISPSPETNVDVESEIARVVQSVNEWDDRTSPDDYPEHLLITSEELAEILRNFAATLEVHS